MTFLIYVADSNLGALHDNMNVVLTVVGGSVVDVVEVLEVGRASVGDPVLVDDVGHAPVVGDEDQEEDDEEGRRDDRVSGKAHRNGRERSDGEQLSADGWTCAGQQADGRGGQ